MPGYFLYNATAGSAAAHPAAELLDLLKARGEDVELHEFREGERPRDLVSNAVAAGAAWVAVAGGDGTIEDAARALVGTQVPLGIIPCGTYNNFALSTGTPMDPCDACRTIAAGKTRSMDVGHLDDEPFFECVGVGLDAALFPLGEEIKSGGVLRWLDLLHRAYQYRRRKYQLIFDRPVGEAVAEDLQRRHFSHHLRRVRRHSLNVRALMITVSNGPYYGMNFTVAPTASVNDGFLTVSVFKRFNKLSLFWHFLSISFGRRVVSPELLTFRAKSIEIRGSKQPVHRDGNPQENWPLKIDLRENALTVFSTPSTT